MMSFYWGVPSQHVPSFNISVSIKVSEIRLEVQDHMNRIRGVMVKVLASSAVDRPFESLSDQTKLVFVDSPLSMQY
jgi:hypothetical protein